MRKLRRASIEWEEWANSRGEARHTASTTKTDIECKTNDDVPERGHHHNLRLNFCITEHGWIGAGGGPVGDFLCLVCAPVFEYLFCCFCSFIPAIAYGFQAV